MDNQSFEGVKYVYNRFYLGFFEPREITKTFVLNLFRAKWDIIFKDPLLSLTTLREKGVIGNICSQGLRSVCWKVSFFLMVVFLRETNKLFDIPKKNLK